MNTPAAIARALATAFVAGKLETSLLVERGSGVLGRGWRWLGPLARRVEDRFAGKTPPRRAAVARFLLADGGFLRAWEKHDLRVANPLGPAPAMNPVGAAAPWGVPPIRTAGELADWLAVTTGELDWFADRRGLGFKQEASRLRHYHYRPLAKRFGEIRLIEAPKPRLKEIQRRILREILAKIPPHSAAHGFRAGRSITSFAQPHVGRPVVLKLDLQDFFPSISSARIEAVFRTAGYPEEVADLLAGLCTHATPWDAWNDGILGPGVRDRAGEVLRQARWRYARRHLPQGAPSSPALANLCANRLDCRLTGLARVAGAEYTRYADDLAFSGEGEWERSVRRFYLHVAAAVMEEGFTVHFRKTRIMRQGVSQRLAGLVLNERLNIPREDFDRLKATLTNCIRTGPESQNREGHDNFRAQLDGRVSFVETIHPSKGRRLRELFVRIVWPG